MGEINTNVDSHSMNYSSHTIGSVTSINNQESELHQTAQTYTSNVETEYVDLGNSSLTNQVSSEEKKSFFDNFNAFFEDLIQSIQQMKMRSDAVSALQSAGVIIDADAISNVWVTGVDGNVYNVELNNGNFIQIDGKTSHIYQIQSNGFTYTDYLGKGLTSENGIASNIFDDSRIDTAQYGGNQESFIKNTDQLLRNEDIRKILETHFPNATEEDYSLYLKKVGDVGCAYTAEVNAIFKEYHGREQEFHDTFGISMYRITENGEVVFNYEPLILDWFTYLWNEHYGITNIDEIYGNSGKISVTDPAFTGNVSTGAIGLDSDTKLIFEDYLQERFNISADLEQKNSDDLLLFKEAIYDNYKDKTVILGGQALDLYSIDPITKERGELAIGKMGGHAMVVTDITPLGEIVVSSWGQQFILDNINENVCELTIVDIMS